jgi:uncharacterized damage-inducible protein DinB
MAHPLRHWIDLWDYLNRNFWGVCRWVEHELSPAEIGWQPVPAVASIGWNLQHLGEMLDHYLTHVFQVRKRPLGREPLVTMIRDSQDDGRFRDLAAIMSYHRALRPEYRKFLETLTAEDMDRPLSSRPDAHTVAWAVGHIAEHESYHVGKCMLLRNLILSERQKR